jgi:hypothetical protein
MNPGSMARTSKLPHAVASIEFNPTSTILDSSFATELSATKSSWRQRNLHGWRFGIFTGCLLAWAVLLANTIIAIVAAVKGEGDTDISAQKTLYKGDCEYMRKLNIGAHLLINILSTFLLGASNYAMQCLSAPTRLEVDVAHSQRIWLDIGVPGVRNIKRISKWRAFLWLVLGLSSLPLHLL